ncbi:MAG: hypothetical protein R2875_06785 [Desulfobacterales bacterium]
MLFTMADLRQGAIIVLPGRGAGSGNPLVGGCRGMHQPSYPLIMSILIPILRGMTGHWSLGFFERLAFRLRVSESSDLPEEYGTICTTRP